MAHPALEQSIGEHGGRRCLFGQCCRRCGTILFPVGSMCADCGGVDLERVPLAGAGRVFSWTAVRRAAPGLQVPYVVALVDFQEGPRIFGQLRAQPGEVRSGMAVAVEFGVAPAGQPDDAYFFVPAHDAG